MKELEAKISELEAKIATYQQLEEQHLAHIDRQAERIAELRAEIEANDNYIDDLERGDTTGEDLIQEAEMAKQRLVAYMKAVRGE